jgi:DNA polymerase-3 subunit delta'
VDGLIKVDRVREVQEKLRYRIERGMKVVIVDGADKLKKEAANAFLKTLEEPPPETLIVLVTSRATELLPTIHSRCQRLNFRPLPEEAVRDLLVSSLGVDPAEAAVAARLSAGSVARAARYAGQERGGTRREVLECVSRLDPADTAALLDAASEWSRRDDLEEALEVLKSWYRDKAVTAFGAGRMVANTDMAAPPGRPVPFRGLYDSFTAVEKARAEITPPRYGNRLLVMENLLLRLAECGGLG